MNNFEAKLIMRNAMIIQHDSCCFARCTMSKSIESEMIASICFFSKYDYWSDTFWGIASTVFDGAGVIEDHD